MEVDQSSGAKGKENLDGTLGEKRNIIGQQK